MPTRSMFSPRSAFTWSKDEVLQHRFAVRTLGGCREDRLATRWTRFRLIIKRLGLLVWRVGDLECASAYWTLNSLPGALIQYVHSLATSTIDSDHSSFL